MSHPGNALQKGIYDRLAGYGALTTALGSAKIYDHVPQNSVGSYVRIGEDTRVEWDTKTNNGWDCTATIHVFLLEAMGQKTLKTLMGHVYDALHQNEGAIVVAGFNLLVLEYEFDESFLEPGVEGSTDQYWHGVLRFRGLLNA